jgi:arginyl-tRNA synthetase
MEEIKNLLQHVIRELFDITIEVVFTRPEVKFGDFATNVALQIAQNLTDVPAGGPRGVAEAIVANLQHETISKAEVAGPGFINLTLSDQALLKLMTTKPSKPLTGKKILVEYSDPNPLKPLHAGHLYATLVGDTIARLIENAGADITRLNYGGDVGRHVAISMWSILKNLQGENPEKLSDITHKPQWLGERYVEGTAAFEDNETAKQEILVINKRVYELHDKNDHESPFAQIYWTCRQWSYDYFASLYTQLQVVPFDRFIPESEVTPLGVQIVEAELAKGVFEKSDGAVIFNGEKYGLHTRVFINSEGLPTYETKDVGLSLTKWKDYHADQSIITTANEQAQYMQVVLKAIEQFEPEAAKSTTHLTFGFVKLQGGVKMSSRKGNIVTALDVLNAARQAGEESSAHPTEDTILAAVKYAFAKNRIGGDIIYDPIESIALEGNSGPYLQYAHARACSILRKGQEKVDKQITIGSLEPGERLLVGKMGEYAEIIDRATAELMPHHICTFLYELAQTFNRFYEQNRVIGDTRQSERLSLILQYTDILKSGLELLGIHAPEEM